MKTKTTIQYRCDFCQAGYHEAEKTLGEEHEALCGKLKRVDVETSDGKETYIFFESETSFKEYMRTVANRFGTPSERGINFPQWLRFGGIFGMQTLEEINTRLDEDIQADLANAKRLSDDKAKTLAALGD